jgi:beta-xylosidase
MVGSFKLEYSFPLFGYQGRETVLTNVTWAQGGWPVFENVSGTIGGPTLPLHPHIRGDG